MSSNVKTEEQLRSVFLHREVAIDMVYGLFDRYVFSWF